MTRTTIRSTRADGEKRGTIKIRRRWNVTKTTMKTMKTTKTTIITPYPRDDGSDTFRVRTISPRSSYTRVSSSCYYPRRRRTLTVTTERTPPIVIYRRRRRRFSFAVRYEIYTREEDLSCVSFFVAARRSLGYANTDASSLYCGWRRISPYRRCVVTNIMRDGSDRRIRPIGRLLYRLFGEFFFLNCTTAATTAQCALLHSCRHFYHMIPRDIKGYQGDTNISV